MIIITNIITYCPCNTYTYRRRFEAKYECGTSEYNVISCDEASGTLLYTMVIRTIYACNGENGNGSNNSNTTTTMGPSANETCVYTVVDNENDRIKYTLDLSSLTYSIMQVTNGIWIYSYSPCINGLSCNSINTGYSNGYNYNNNENEFAVMINQYKTTNGNTNCSAYLALWDEYVSPTYHNGTFTFIWENGEASNECQRFVHV